MIASACLQRTFKEGQLWFDDTHGELRWTVGSTVPLIAEASKALPGPLVYLHLS